MAHGRQYRRGFGFCVPLVLFPDYYIGLGRRLLMPWDRRPAVMPFAMDFTPGDAFAARGRPLTIAVEFRPTHEKSALPNACTLVMTGEDQKQVRLKMPAGGTANSFAFRIDELKSNVRYHIEAGQIESEGHAVIAVDPVELAGGPTTVLSPPPYAKSVAIQTIEGPNDLAILQFGQVAIDCRFDRPAESATLIVTPISGSDLTPHAPAIVAGRRSPIRTHRMACSKRRQAATRTGRRTRHRDPDPRTDIDRHA